MADQYFSTWVDALPVDTVGGSEKIPVVDAGTEKYQTPDLIKTYILAALTASAAVTPTTGDALLVERAGSEGTFDLDALCDYVYDYLYDNGSVVTPAVSGDELLLERGGTKYRVDIDTLVNFVNSENGTLAQQITALAAATMADSDEYVLNQGGTGKKVSFTNLAARVHAQFNAYLTALTAVVTPADANELYILQGATAKKMTLTVLANTYLAAELNLENLQWATAATTPSLAGDKFLMERSGAISEVDIDTVVTYAATGLQAGVLDFSALASASPGPADEFVVDDAGTPKSLTLAALQAKIRTDYPTYLSGLSQNLTVTASDKFYCVQGGTPKYCEPDELATYIGAGTGDVSGPVATTEHSFPQWDSTTKLLKDGFPFVTTVRFDGSESDTNLATEKAVSDAIEDITNLDIDGATDIGGALAGTDLIIVDDGAGGTNRKCAISRISTYIGTAWENITNLDIDGGTDIGAALVDADLIIVDDGASGTNRKAAMSRVATYIDAGNIANFDINGGTDIGAALVDADLIVVDDGATGTNRKCALSRLKTYLTASPPIGDMYVSAASASANITQTVYLNVLANATVADAGASSDFTIDNTNKRMTYTGTNTVLFHVTGAFSFISSESTVVARFRLAKNGSTIAATEVSRKIGTGSDEGACAVNGIISLATNDYVELWATLDTVTAPDTITVETLNMSAVPLTG
jgi:hypothetical protein